VYDRISVLPSDHFSINDRAKAIIPYGNVEWFVQEKYKIAADFPGSGNTTNIGSIRSANINDFKDGKGPFAQLGEAVFRDYWKSYDKNKASRAYRKYSEYLNWKANRDVTPI
jgi:hypothetical protein